MKERDFPTLVPCPLSLVRHSWSTCCNQAVGTSSSAPSPASCTSCTVQLCPLLQLDSLHTKFYRASHVLCVASYWCRLFNSAMSILQAPMLIVHAIEANEHHSSIAEQIMDICWLCSVPEDLAPPLRKNNYSCNTLSGTWPRITSCTNTIIQVTNVGKLAETVQ